MYDAPARRFVAQFVGAANVFDGDAARRLSGHASATLRPERICLGAASGSRTSGTVQEVQYFGAFARVKVATPDALLQADLPAQAAAVPTAQGDAVHLHRDERAVHALAEGVLG